MHEIKKLISIFKIQREGDKDEDEQLLNLIEENKNETDE
jgi:hypothetical protein